MGHSVKRLTSGPDLKVREFGASPASGSVLTAQSLEPASDSVSPSLSAPPLLTLSLSLSLKNKQTLFTLVIQYLGLPNLNVLL